MKCPWKTAGDVQRYMNNCIFRYDGQPYYVTVTGPEKLNLYRLEDVHNGMGPAEYCSTQDDKLDVESPPLGYYNHRKGAYRLERQPYKQFSQGINEKNTHILNIEGERQFDETILCRGVEDMFLGNYPTFAECWSLLDKQKSVALSIDAALARTGKGYPTMVYFRGSIVGYVSPDTMVVIVPSSERGWIVSRYLQHFGWDIQ